MILRASPLNFLHTISTQSPDLLDSSLPSFWASSLCSLHSAHPQSGSPWSPRCPTSPPIIRAQVLLRAPLLLQGRERGQCREQAQVPTAKSLWRPRTFSALYASEVGYVIPILRTKKLEKLSPAPVCRAGTCQRRSSALSASHSSQPRQG